MLRHDILNQVPQGKVTNSAVLLPLGGCFFVWSCQEFFIMLKL